ncbi:MAG TPA: CapA family protein, partial [Anaerolineales bacterium]|nr:CapA family protein [Anaerolineales bacterium]
MAVTRLAGVLLGVLLLLAASPGPRAAAASAFGWVYLRGGEVPAPDESLVEVLAVGDVMTGRGMEDVRAIFTNVSSDLLGADLTIGNLEGALSPTRVADDSMYLLLPLSTPATLAEAGFDLVGIANNHALDAGIAGRAETRRLLREAGLEPVEATAAVVQEIGGM